MYTLHENDQLKLEAKKIGINKVISKSGPVEHLFAAIREQLQNSQPIGPVLGDLTQTFQAPQKAAVAAEMNMSERSNFSV